MKLLTHEQVAALLREGRFLLLAGDEAALRRVPRGTWIGGTIPYFMTDDGGCQDRDRIFAHVLPPQVRRAHVRTYDATQIEHVYEHGFARGMSALILPASTDVHLAFANGAPGFPGFAHVPLFGWISGVHLSDLGKVRPLVFDGARAEALDAAGVALHAELEPGWYANVDIVNLFQQGVGDTLEFPQTGFTADRVRVNGEERSFYEYVTAGGIDLKRPLVTDLCGAMVNVSFQGLDHEKKVVNFYAPVFDHLHYRQAAPVEDYVADFRRTIGDTDGARMTFSCNCILNYLYAELEGKKTATFGGPITFGEIAYQLLNQTLVYVEVKQE